MDREGAAGGPRRTRDGAVAPAAGPSVGGPDAGRPEGRAAGPRTEGLKYHLRPKLRGGRGIDGSDGAETVGPEVLSFGRSGAGASPPPRRDPCTGPPAVGEHLRDAGYSEVRTPLLFSSTVFETSGHWEHFRDNMFLTSVDGRPYGVKPMNCPGAMLVFRARARSYRELPLRLAEWAPLHRLEASGTLHGLTRVRGFTQDDAHIFLTEEQIETEVRTLLRWIREAFSTFDLAWKLELSTRPEKFLGEIAQWDRAEALLRGVLDSSGAPYHVNPGDGAFYGPKIDVYVRDSIGRSWQTGTIQVDYQQPIRFGLEYQGADGGLHRPIVVHRTVLGSFERFTGILLEHCAGRLPPWLAPVQVRLLPVSERHLARAEELAREWRGQGIRAEASDSATTLSKRVRAGEVEKVPYLAVVGDTEIATGQVTLRIHGEKAPRALAAAEAAALLVDRIRQRSFRP